MESLTQSVDNNPLNLNSSNFNSEAYVNNLLQKNGLDELVAVEEDMVQNVRRLDSEIQQLAYENYNKFLTATNTVRNMQTAFTEMDNVKFFILIFNLICFLRKFKVYQIV